MRKDSNALLMGLQNRIMIMIMIIDVVIGLRELPPSLMPLLTSVVTSYLGQYLTAPMQV